MNKLKVNRRDFVSLDNIEKIVIKKNGMFGQDIWVYKKRGYPPILKCLEGLAVLKNRLTNLGKTIFDFKLEKES